MVFFLTSPTGTTIRMGGVYTAYTNITPVPGTNIIRLNATLGPLRSAGSGGAIAAGAVTQLSLSFAGQPTNNVYPG